MSVMSQKWNISCHVHQPWCTLLRSLWPVCHVMEREYLLSYSLTLICFLLQSLCHVAMCHITERKYLIMSCASTLFCILLYSLCYILCLTHLHTNVCGCIRSKVAAEEHFRYRNEGPFSLVQLQKLKSPLFVRGYLLNHPSPHLPPPSPPMTQSMRGLNWTDWTVVNPELSKVPSLMPGEGQKVVLLALLDGRKFAMLISAFLVDSV